MLSIVILLITLALIFDFINGFHDAANSIATVVSTRVLSPAIAVVWAAFFNFIAAFGGGVKVANTMGKGVIHFELLKSHGTSMVLSVIFASLLGAILWNLLTWWWGLPSSSSHALAGGLIGATLPALGLEGLVADGIAKIALFIVLSPVLGLVLGSTLMILTTWIVRRRAAAHDPGGEDHQRRAEHQPQHGREHDEERDLGDAVGDQSLEAERRKRCADEPARQRVRGGRGQAPPPGEQVPEDGAEQGGKDHAQHHRGAVRFQQLEVDDALAHGVRDLHAAAERRDEVEERRPDHGDGRREYPRRHHRGDGVRRVVEAVDEVEDQRERDQEDDDREHSGVLQHHAFDHVGHVLAAVGGRLDQIVDLLPLDDRQRVGAALEQGGDGGAAQRVGVAFECLDLAASGEDLRGALDVPEQPDRLLHLLGGGHQDARQILRRLWNGPHFVQQQPLRRGVGEVEHVVDASQQAVDLRPVEGGDELPV